MSRREPGGLPDEVLKQVVSANVSRLPAYVGVPVPDAGYVLLRISRVIEADPTQKPGADSAAAASQLFGGAQFQAFLVSLRERGEIEVRKQNLEKK